MMVQLELMKALFERAGGASATSSKQRKSSANVRSLCVTLCNLMIVLCVLCVFRLWTMTLSPSS